MGPATVLVLSVLITSFIPNVFAIEVINIEAFPPHQHHLLYQPAASPITSPPDHRHRHHHHHSPSPSPSHPPLKPPSHPPLKPPSYPPVKPPTKPPVKPPGHPVKPPTKPPVKPPTYPPLKPPTKPPLKPPTYPPVKPPTKPPSYPPLKPPTLPPVKPPTKPPTYPPVKPPSFPPLKPPSHPPVLPPTPPPTRKAVAVQGVVFCKSCKYKGIDTLVGASPLAGAVVKLECRNTRYPLRIFAKTDKNGYFFIKPTKTLSTFGVKKCRVSLISSPSKTCNIPTNFHNGIIGSLLKPEKTNFPKYVLYTVAPLAFEPAKTVKCH